MVIHRRLYHDLLLNKIIKFISIDIYYIPIINIYNRGSIGLQT